MVLKRLKYVKHINFIKEILLEKKKLFWGILFLNIVLGLLGLVIPYFSKWQIEQLQSQQNKLFGIIYESPLNLFITLVALVAVIKLISEAIRGVIKRLTHQIEFRAGEDMEQKLLNKLVTFDVSFLNNPKNNSITDSIFSSSYFFESLMRLFESIVRDLVFLGILPIVFFIDSKVFLVISIFGILEILINFWWQNYNMKMNALVELENSSSGRLKWLLFNNLDKLVPMNAQDSIFSKIKQDKRKSFKLTMNLDKEKDVIQLMINFFKEIPDILVMALIGMKVFDGKATLGDFTMISMYSMQLSNMFSSLSWLLRDSQDLLIRMSRINFFFSLKERIISPKRPKKVKISGNVEFKNLHFHYPVLDDEERAYLKDVVSLNEKILAKVKSFHYDREQLKRWGDLLKDHSTQPEEVLKGINLKIRKGEITALIGRNGAGKTTAANLLMKGYSPSSGEILIDGVNVNDFVPEDLRNQVAIIHQSPLFLNGLTIRENLLLGVKKEVNDRVIWRWLKRVDLFEPIKEQPRGLDTIMGEDTSFSGGQIQLLAIVRIILQDRKIIIFDEGTNQLDAEHEGMILEILKELKAKKAIFIITHKMTTARRADQIYVMDCGQIVEEGKHQKLLNLENGLYKKFWELQVVN